MRTGLAIFAAVGLALAVGGGTASAQERLDRTVLPIPEPKLPIYRELDARNAKAPPRFEVKAPNGAPTTQNVYDNLDIQREVQAFLTAVTEASAAALRHGFRERNLDNQTFVLFENLTDSKSLFLTKGQLSGG